MSEYVFGGYRGFWTEAIRLAQFGGLPKDRAATSIDTQEQEEQEIADQYCNGKRATQFRPPTTKRTTSTARKAFYPPSSNKPSSR